MKQHQRQIKSTVCQQQCIHINVITLLSVFRAVHSARDRPPIDANLIAVFTLCAHFPLGTSPFSLLSPSVFCSALCSIYHRPIYHRMLPLPSPVHQSVHQLMLTVLSELGGPLTCSITSLSSKVLVRADSRAINTNQWQQNGLAFGAWWRLNGQRQEMTPAMGKLCGHQEVGEK